MTGLLRLALVLVFLLAGLSAAQAHFLVAPIVVAIMGATFAAQVVTFVITAALSVGLSYVASQLLNKGDRPNVRSPDSVGGVQLDIRVDPDTQRSIIFGRTATAGSLVYANTWGKTGNQENSNLIQIIALSDVPITDVVETWVEGKKRAITGTTGERTVTDYIKKGEEGEGEEPDKPDVPLLRYLLHNGTQTTADAITTAKFGTDPLRPWTSDMKGLGVAYVRTQEIYDKDLVPGMTQWKFVIDGIKLYDLRKDPGVPGGSAGGHSWNTTTAGTNSSNYTFTQNAALIAYNILRGIYYKGQLVYGLGLKPEQLPANVWIAAANACAPSAGGTTTGTYLWGAEITVDTEPMAVLREIIKACGGRFVEIGGVYKMYVETEAVPHYIFTDKEVVGNRESSFKPFLPMEQRTNYMTGRYTSPVNWLPKISPPRMDLPRIAEDGRRLPAELDCPGVHNRTQMQRLMKQLLFRSRQERRHVVTLPPPAFPLEAGDIVMWDSVRNRYPTKLFDVESVEYHDNLCVTVSITEIDPNDYNWIPADEINEPDGPLPTQKPPPMPIEGFTATGIIVAGSANESPLKPIPGTDPVQYVKKDQRPAILVEWIDPVDDDFYAVDIQYRRYTTTELFTDRGNDVPAQGVMILANIAPQTTYEVRGKYRTHSGKGAAWHPWIRVVTPNVRPKIGDSDPSIKQYVEDYSKARAGEVQDSLDDLNSLYTTFTGDTYPADKKELNDAITTGDNNVRSEYKTYVGLKTDLRLPPQNAIATAINSLNVSVGKIKAGIKVEYVTGITPALTAASYRLVVTANKTYAGMQVVVIEKKDTRGIVISRTSQTWFDVDYFMIGRSAGAIKFQPMLTVESKRVGTKIVSRMVLNGDLIAAGAIKATHLAAETLTAIHADLGTVKAGTIDLTKTNIGRLRLTDNKTVAGAGPELTIYRWV